MVSRRDLIALALIAACGKRAPARLEPDRVPLAGDPISLDGEWREPAWNQRALRRVFVGDDGAEARPYSELRLLRDEATLYVGLYAADEDIRSTDAFDVSIGAVAARITAAGVAEPPLPVGIDRDGTLDRPDDYDEEWVIEAAFPLARLGPPPFAVAVSRCDVTKPGARRCGAWRGRVDLARVSP
jgi:hypothetical protein